MLFMYEAIKSIKDACNSLSLIKNEVVFFYSNAEKLIRISNKGSRCER